MQSGEGTAQTNRPAGVNKVVYVISLHIKCKCFSCDNNNTVCLPRSVPVGQQ